MAQVAVVLSQSFQFPFRGYQIVGDSHFLYVLPVSTSADMDDRWNLDLLVEVIGGQLPYGARLQFYQALHRKELVRQISSTLVDRFARVAFAIGTSPIPVSDILVLTPLQMLMIAVIGGLSCRSFSRATAAEYLTACGLTLGKGLSLRVLAQQLIKLIPVAGQVISGALAAAGTYALGKSAEAYFFSGEVKSPDAFEKEGKKAAQEIENQAKKA
jgi:uncharacterized protein (DUF697 family)